MSAVYIGHSGRLLDPFQIEKYDFTAMELLKPICKLARYTGQTKRPYYVGEHTYHLIKYVPQPLKRAVALHDLNESITNDLARPFKAELPEYCAIEERVQRHIFNVFGEPWENMEAIAEYDSRICTDEMAQTFERPYYRDVPGLGIEIPMWEWDVAETYLKGAFKEIGLL